ncbi:MULTISPECIES: glutamine--tRNA ligase/YqeY domain fusion protein [Eubacteriales]|uniref:glutamine--tRNA ligase/YqeY domain fusion protein n=1 Tax=Eubacteriales TaxID=186802 RepID=UPI0003415168|nr:MULTISPECIES: glutamine--tRNA ligase/YqeY domain fusion protein [Eubacteriales]MCB6989368.1 glutamine--tRNA ligase/YqeY domain fusion protein [bacterium 210820-DFI.6.38]RJW88294.1 glutamine--tRNA ligase/YqeY domain fusion protein [Clostridiales bacterium AF36-10]UYJ14139.1 MAG: glutamine--tRNA ligase/YqeY domain fusion protein [Lachnospiraceae bacterium]CCY09915.1 glutamine--tRNA ligase [Clostridium sp. CAG:81]SCI02361.1 Glutamine--tRNA ligase [uncultured Clostridium sp.]
MAENMTPAEETKEVVSKNFIEQEIDKDLAEGVYDHVQTRFPPEPNGYLHIGHAKSIILNSGLAKEYGGKFNLRFDDTNPTKEKTEFVHSITEDVKWLGADFEDRLFFASDYFDTMYECAVKLIKKGKAFVCDLSADQIKEYRGDFTTPGKNSPYRDRSVEENLQLFENMKNGMYKDGEKVLRAKIDMASPNINMRDPVIYRVAHMTHHNTGDKWCIYPMYDFAHPIEDAVEHITHSICTLEFEDHRPLYDWVVRECEFENPPRQIEFAKMYLTNVVTGKRYIKKLVEDGIVDGWDDPRLVTIAALRRRGYTPEALRMFVELVGVSKANSSVDYAMLEYCIREDLKLKRPRMMAVLDPVKLIIDNYPEGQTEMLSIPNNLENPEMGEREVPFSRELYIEREDFMENPPKKYFRLFPGNEVRLMGAYFVTCTGFEKDENGNVTEIHCTYDPETKSGSGFTGRKVKGTIHWVSAPTAGKVECRLYENIVDEEKGKLNADGTLNLNPNSKTITTAYVEPKLMEAKAYDSFQFMRNGYYCVDCKDSKEGQPVYNRIVSLKSSFKLPK